MNLSRIHAKKGRCLACTLGIGQHPTNPWMQLLFEAVKLAVKGTAR